MQEQEIEKPLERIEDIIALAKQQIAAVMRQHGVDQCTVEHVQIKWSLGPFNY